jgi:hypothetical protein
MNTSSHFIGTAAKQAAELAGWASTQFTPALTQRLLCILLVTHTTTLTTTTLLTPLPSS